MILRRVIAHFRKQEWTAIFLDFLIVVLGVFVGLQVNNWNAAQKDETRAIGYLERIRNDLDADITSNRTRLEFWRKVSVHGRRALAFASTGEIGEFSDWELLLSFFQASQVGEMNTTDATYEELKSAGELGLIGDADLRDRLAYYYVNSINPTMEQRPAYRDHVREIIPIDVQLYIWDTCYRTSTRGGQDLLDCPPPPGAARIGEIVRRVSGDGELIGELTFWISSLRVSTLIAESRIDMASVLARDIDAILAKTRRAAAS